MPMPAKVLPFRVATSYAKKRTSTAAQQAATVAGVVALLIAVPAFAHKDPVLRPLGVTVSFPEDNRIVFEYDRAGSISAITIYLAASVYTVPADICAKLGTVHMETVRLEGPAVVWHKDGPQIFYVSLKCTSGSPSLFLDVQLTFRNDQFFHALVTGPMGEITTWQSSSR
jgi:hypothetical protein